MAAKNTTEGFQFLVEELKANKDAVYGELKEKADRKGLTVFPVMFGRAKLMLGLAKKKAKARAAAPAREGRRVGRPANPDSKSARIRELLGSGMTATEIAKKVGASVALVYSLRGRGGATKRAP